VLNLRQLSWLRKRKEVKNMKYSKPELNVLSDAITAIATFMQKPVTTQLDHINKTTYNSAPAYEADE
jgi:hypothetical protein